MTRLYESCMALDTIDSDKYTPLRKIINQMGTINYILLLLWHVYWERICYICYLIKEIKFQQSPVIYEVIMNWCS
jgi:hypothetical protein